MATAAPWRRSRQAHQFLKGPIPLRQIQLALDAGPNSNFRTSLALWHEAGIRRRLSRLVLRRWSRKIWRITPQQISRSRLRLERAGLIKSTLRPGRLTQFDLLSPEGFFREIPDDEILLD